MVFLPGKSELLDVQEALENLHINSQWIAQLHGDLDDDQKESALSVADHPKAILATSIAETSITMPQIDHVLDAGFCRTTEEYHDIVDVVDFRAPSSVQDQRDGRAARKKPGCSTRFVPADYGDKITALPLSLESIAFVLALEKHHFAIRADALSLCTIPEGRIDTVRQRTEMLGLSSEQLFTAVSSLPFSLRDAAAYMRAGRYDARWEVAALLIFKNTCHWKAKAQFKLADIISAVTDKKRPSSAFPASKTDQARRQFSDLRLRGPWVKHEHLEEVVATALLACPERLVWRETVDDQACFLGEPLVEFKETGHSVVALLKSSKQGLRCSLSLPYTDWVKQEADIPTMARTAKVLSDSTVLEFRAGCILKLRKLGYDTKMWRCKSGAQEASFAASVIMTPSVDLAIVFPNGNRLSRQEDPHERGWVQPAAQELSTALNLTAKEAVVFVGDGIYSPGVLHIDAYRQLVGHFQRRLGECGVPVVASADGVRLEADGIHWHVLDNIHWKPVVGLWYNL